MQVVGFEKVAVDDSHEADAGPHEQVGRDAAQRPAAAHEHARRQQPPLALFAQRRESHLAAIAIELGVGMRSSSHHSRDNESTGKS